MKVKKIGRQQSNYNVIFQMKKQRKGYLCVLFMAILMMQTVVAQQQHSNQPADPNGANQEYYKMNSKQSRSEKIQVQQKAMYKRVEQRVAIDTKFTNFIFTVQGVQEFLLNLPITQQVAINMFTYEIRNNAYMRPQNIQNQAPIRIMIYENNNRLIYQSHFYFQAYVVFQGQQLSTYTIRFINPGAQKLITMNVKKLTQSSHIEKAINSTVLSEHATRASQLLQQFKFLANAFQRYTMINFQAIKAAISNINIYYYWNIVETVLAILVCLIQVTFISKVCKTSSIV